jgi:hypothetical protein
MPSADFCTGVREPHGPLSLVAETRRRPPEVSSTTFTAHPPDLQPQALDGYGLRDQLSARPTWAASYPVSVRQVAASLHASFRPRLAATPLRFARTSPPSGCAGDFHPQAVEHARHTTKPLRGRGRSATAFSPPPRLSFDLALSRLFFSPHARFSLAAEVGPARRFGTSQRPKATVSLGRSPVEKAAPD